jgi:hypothetical protein
MKYLLIIITAFISLSCKEKGQEIINIETKVDTIKKKNNELTYNFDTIKISSLPFGNKMLIDNFKKTGSDYEVTKKENDVYMTSGSIFFKLYERLIENNKTSFSKFYKFPQKNTIDFGLNFITPVDSISTYQGYYALTDRLPNIGKYKILIFNSVESENDLFNLAKNIDLVIVNNENRIIDNLNLSRRLHVFDEMYYNQYDDYFKYFYIDKDYTIHIKYFTGWGDAYVRVFAYVKYKIQEDGTIVRYFDQANGFYKTEAEEGNIKNHLKDGTWKEMGTYFEKMYYTKEYKEGKLQKNKFDFVKVFDDSETTLTIDNNTFETIDRSFKMLE